MPYIEFNDPYFYILPPNNSASFRPADTKADETQTLFDMVIRKIKYSKLLNIREKIQTSISALGIEKHIIDLLILSTTEILSNLLQHTSKPPNYTRIRIYQTPTHLILDIADNSSPFANFNAKCKESQACVLKDPLRSSGRGLGIMLEQHDECLYTPSSDASDLLNHFTIKHRYSKKCAISQNRALKNVHTDLSEEKLFIIDDDPFFRKLLQAALEQYYQLFIYEDAETALRDFEKHRPDLVISDLYMPNMNGAELRKALSKLPNGNSTPFVFLSSYNQDNHDHHQYFNQLGVDDFITKPFKQENLLNTLRRLISRSKQLQSSFQDQFDDDITKCLAPDLPKTFNNWECQVYSYTAEAGGGDFITYEEYEDGSGIILSDIMGHGITAKFFSYAYAGYLRSLFKASPDKHTPDIFLNTLSKAVREDSFLDTHITTCLSLWLDQTGQVTLSSAGHPWPIKISDNLATPIEISGPLPGLIGATDYPSKTLLFEKGDYLVFYTDGFLEQRNLKYRPEKTLHNFCAKLTNILLVENGDFGMLWKEYIQKNDFVNDDATLIVLKYNGELNNE